MSKVLVDLSDQAAAYLAGLVNSASEQQKGLYLRVKRAGCSGYKYEKELVSQPQTDAITQSVKGITLWIDAKSVPLLEGVCLDYVADGFGTKLVFRHAKTSSNICGCGESFASNISMGDENA